MTWSPARLRQWLTQIDFGTGVHYWTDAQPRLRLRALRSLPDVSTAGLDLDWHEDILWPLARLIERMMQQDELAAEERLAAFRGVLRFAEANNDVWHQMDLAACLGLWEAFGRAAQRSGSAREGLRDALVAACQRAVESGDESSLDHVIAALRELRDPSTGGLLHAMAARELSDRQRDEIGKLLAAQPEGHSPA
ncbi:MAG: hypothetical protein AB7T37_01145 [Dehalococcoidia bacterium]